MHLFEIKNYLTSHSGSNPLDLALLLKDVEFFAFFIKFHIFLIYLSLFNYNFYNSGILLALVIRFWNKELGFKFNANKNSLKDIAF